MHFAESQWFLRFLLLLHFRSVCLWLIGSTNSHVLLLCNADLCLLYFPCPIIVLTWTKYSVWDTFYTSTESSGLRCTIWYSTICGKSMLTDIHVSMCTIWILYFRYNFDYFPLITLRQMHTFTCIYSNSCIHKHLASHQWICMLQH